MKKITPYLLLLFIPFITTKLSAQTPAYKQVFDNYFNSHLSAYNGDVLVQIGCRDRILYTYQAGQYSSNANLDVQSISKLVTSAVIMTLVEENKFALDDKVGQYIPSWNGNGKQDVTIRQLLAHTSGLVANTEYDDRSDITLAQAVDLMATNSALQFTPGTQFFYGSCSYKVASRVAEIVESKPWKQIFAERMANVSGMPNAIFSQRFPYSVDNPLTGQGLECSLTEYSNFLKMILNYGMYNSTRVMDSASIEAMQAKSSEAGVSFVTYGLGQWREEVVNEVAKEFHHPSASGCLEFFNRNKDYYCVILSQAGFDAVNSINQGFRELVRNNIPNNECATNPGPECDFNISASASPSSVATGAATALSYSCSGANCNGVTYAWSGNGVSGSSSPFNITAPGTSGTYTYTVTASKSGCSNKTASTNLTVTSGGGGGSFTQCVESESANGNGAITGDPNASNGQTRGEENNNNHYVDYAISNVPSAGAYTVTLRYYSSAAPTVSVQVNGGSGQTINLPNSGSWNIVSTEQNFTVNLQAGNNTIRIQGTGGGSCRQDKICVNGTGGGGGCSTPAAPSLSASPSTITIGQSTTLTASGCSGTVTWSNGLGTGSSKIVSPTSNTTYTATCTVDGCTSVSAGITVTVGSGSTSFNQCLESESSGGSGTITSDPNASNGQTRGEENSNNHYVDYALTNVPSAGTYYVKLRYYSSSAPVVSVQVNGGSGQTVNLPNSGSWNIVSNEQIFSVNLQAGSNTLRIQGTGGGSCRQDKICVNNSSSFRMASTNVLELDNSIEVGKKELVLSPNPSRGQFEVRFYLAKGQKATLTVTDVTGRPINRRSIMGNGKHKEILQLTNHAAGTYFIQLHKKDGVELKKAVIIR